MSDKFSIELFQKLLRSYSLKWSIAVVFLIGCAFIFALFSHIIAIGDIIFLVFLSIGVNTIGFVAIGVNVGGFLSIGVNAIGFVAIGVNAMGFVAIGANAVGFVAVGYRACGIYVLSYERKSVGIYMFSPDRQDASAIGLFTRLFPQLKKTLMR